MDLFISLALVVAIALIFLCVYPGKLANKVAFRKALSNFFIAVVAHNPAVELFSMVPPHIWGIFFRVLAYVFILLSFRQLCLAFGAPLEDTVPPPANPQ